MGDAKKLFVVEDQDVGTYSMLFYIPPCSERKALADRIWQHGGVVVAEPGCSIYQLKVGGALQAKTHADLFASNLIYEARWVDDCIKKCKIVSKKNYIIPNFRGKRNVTPARQPFSILECLKMYDTVAARVKATFSRSLSFWRAIENTGFFPGRSSQSLHNRWKALSRIPRAQYVKDSIASGVKFCNALAAVPHLDDRDPVAPPIKESQNEAEPPLRKKARRPGRPSKKAELDVFDQDEQINAEEEKEQDEVEENGVAEEEEEDQEDEEAEDEDILPEEAKESAKSIGIAPVGQFLLNVMPRSLHTEFTDSQLEEEKSFISGRVTPTLIKTGPLLRFGTIMPIRHASVTWTPDLNDPQVTVLPQKTKPTPAALSDACARNAKALVQKDPKAREVEVMPPVPIEAMVVFVDSKGKRVTAREDEEKRLFFKVDQRLQELVKEHPTKTYDEMVELLDEVSGNLEDLEELLDGNDDVHQWDELEDLAVQKHKGSQEYKTIVKKLGERQVAKRRAYLSR